MLARHKRYENKADPLTQYLAYPSIIDGIGFLEARACPHRFIYEYRS